MIAAIDRDQRRAASFASGRCRRCSGSAPRIWGAGGAEGSGCAWLSAFSVFIAPRVVERAPPLVGGFCVREPPMLATTSTNTREAEGAAADGLPAIVVKAQEDARCRSALKHMGYSTVRSEHARQRRERLTAFDGLGS